jgi:hypothetical protein
MGDGLDRIVFSSSSSSTEPKVLPCVLGRGPCTVDLVAADTVWHKTDRHPSTEEDSASWITKPSSRGRQVFHCTPPPSSTRPTDKMAQPAPRVIDLSTIRSDGTGQGPVHAYTQIPRQHTDYDNYIQKKLTDAFNKNEDNNCYVAHVLNRYGQHTLCCNAAHRLILKIRSGPHEFIGDLPRGYTLWTHQTESTFAPPEGSAAMSPKC